MYDDLEITKDIVDLFKVNEKSPFSSHDDTVFLDTRVSSSTAYNTDELSFHKDGLEGTKCSENLQSGIEKGGTRGIFYSEPLYGSRDDNEPRNYFTSVHDEHNLQVAESKPIQKRKRGRPKRDPKDRWPKRPLSAYNLFFKDEQLRLSKLRRVQANARRLGEELPAGESVDSQAKTVGSKWKALSKEEKIPYEKKASESMKKYREEVATIIRNTRYEYGPSIDNNTQKDKNSRNKLILENKSVMNRKLSQKRQTSLSGYSIFFQHERERLKHCLSTTSTSNDLDPKGQVSLEGNATKTIVSTWEKMSEEERSFYNALAEANLTTYKREMKSFR